ncbi:MAG: hypothetical protein QXZ59_01620, partial [Nitrososphaeria archaeon]
SDLLSFEWSLSFAVANLILFAFFMRTTTFGLIVFPIIAFAAFLILGEIPRWKSYLSLIAIASISMYYLWAGIALAVVLLIVYVTLTLSYYKKTKEHVGISSAKEGLEIIWRNIFKFMVASLRMLFFNVSYMLFPLLFVWLAIFGGVYLFGHAALSMGLIDFSAVLTVMGVIFGLLQYYFSRHEEKVQQKLNIYFTSLTSPIGKFSFNEFYKFLTEHESKYKDVKKEAEGMTDTNMSALAPFFRETGKEKSIIKMNLPNFEDMAKFQLLESKFLRSKKLKEAYKDFFEDKKTEIKKDLHKRRASLNELVWFLFSNITIVEETNASFLTLDLGKKDDEAESYIDFLRLTRIDILKYIFDVVLGIYKPPIKVEELPEDSSD